ncbi:MAG TPA: penicillin acylase family protein [Pyrinomonadaceae bacterium]|nr:penicillin acylase family protein [Pyrinomonadaceae bacterium]
MKSKSLIRISFCLVIAFVSLVAPNWLGSGATQTTQQSTTSLKIAGLKQPVIIRRDERGIPYIEAKSDHDLYLAQGFATATDRLWQMDLLRRTARGELAEVLGKDALDEDKRHRTLGFARAAEAEAAQASAEARNLLDAYAKGVNAYISSLDPKSLPPEFQLLQYRPRPWTPADSLIVVKLFFEALSNSWRLDVMRESLSDVPPAKLAALLTQKSPLDVIVVGKDVPAKRNATQRAISTNTEKELLIALEEEEEVRSRALARVGLYAESLAASNNWVVSGNHTASGKPLLANDPHLAPSAPPIWHMAHLTAPGVRVAGVTAPGLPGVVIGHNEHIAWGFTNVGTDVQDLYLESFDPENPKRYQTPTGWQDAEVRYEAIKVRNTFTDKAIETVVHYVTTTRHGPIVLDRAGKRYALRWTAIDPRLHNALGFYRQNRARNWKEFAAALQTYTGPMQNMIYADSAGHIGYYAAGVVPIRKTGDGSVPYDGSTDDGEWVSFVPFEELPHLFDPPSGIIVTANQRVVGSDYPYHLSHSWAQPYRARRILDLLQKNQKMTADDFRRVLGDIYTIAGANFAKQTARILRADLRAEGDDELRKLVGALETWDGQLNVDSRVAPVVAQMRISFRSKIINAALGEERARSFGWSNFDTTLDRILNEQSKEWLPKEFSSYAAMLRASHADAVQVLTRALGADQSQWTWGNMVKARFPHPLARAPLVGLPFAIDPLPQNGTGFMLGATVNVGAAVSMRLIADPSNWDKTQHGITLGQSGLPTSPHWKDQLPDWQAVTPRVFPFSEAAIAHATKSTLVLEP